MELWIIFSKLIIILFLSFSYVQSETGNLAWIVLSILVYISINITVYLVQSEKVKIGIHLVSMTLIFIFFREVNSLFILLLPNNIYELTWPFFGKKWLLLVVGLMPVLIVPLQQASYSLVALFCFVVYFMSIHFSKRLLSYENTLDKMRVDMQRLSKSLHENKEYIRQSEYTYRLEERNRISQQIHDSIGHSMTGALIQMEAAKTLVAIDQTKAVELLQNAINISKEGIEDIRITLKNMKPPSEQIGLQRLKLFIEEFSIQHQLRMPFVYKGNIDLITPIQWKIITENITEALTNSLKYSGASEISIDFQVLNKLVRVEVRDNGKGIGSGKVVKGLGIVGMEERTASIKGTIIVDGTNGFSVTTLLPIA
ncbi:sensor histidine kinase [Neobacillus cucumis]|uniref:sensor histidine kinase n=1 Tax=Neobacillus cucumis TaxID=1740721 RepID=UPI002040F567|nr:sensor histidine kinase [Neobacillus cucumis]MCM3727781.1 sensor histidine kinase [Neobacillus cucumis]